MKGHVCYERVALRYFCYLHIFAVGMIIPEDELSRECCVLTVHVSESLMDWKTKIHFLKAKIHTSASLVLGSKGHPSLSHRTHTQPVYFCMVLVRNK